ncbi:MAG: hypothetical protein EOO01_13415 [Chitinophagaceae bacterium]|nr:MAG: hypothetical protein EOO01_13415 [Chitinophagaceae bacterium]
MFNRSLKYGFVLPVLMLLSCGSEPSVDNASAAATAGADTNFSNPFQLTEEDLMDDSVFTDGSRPVSWENAGVTDPIAVKKFIRQLQVWVRDNQADSISGYLIYPMKNPGIKDKADFRLHYSDYITDGVKAALAAQRLNQVFRNEQGVMIGQGQIWLRQKDNEIRIIAINN